MEAIPDGSSYELLLWTAEEFEYVELSSISLELLGDPFIEFDLF